MFKLAVHNYKIAQDEYDYHAGDSETADTLSPAATAPRWTKRNRGRREHKHRGG